MGPVAADRAGLQFPVLHIPRSPRLCCGPHQCLRCKHSALEPWFFPHQLVVLEPPALQGPLTLADLCPGRPVTSITTLGRLCLVLPARRQCGLHDWCPRPTSRPSCFLSHTLWAEPSPGSTSSALPDPQEVTAGPLSPRRVSLRLVLQQVRGSPGERILSLASTSSWSGWFPELLSS